LAKNEPGRCADHPQFVSVMIDAPRQPATASWIRWSNT